VLPSQIPPYKPLSITYGTWTSPWNKNPKAPPVKNTITVHKLLDPTLAPIYQTARFKLVYEPNPSRYDCDLILGREGMEFPMPPYNGVYTLLEIVPPTKYKPAGEWKITVTGGTVTSITGDNCYALSAYDVIVLNDENPYGSAPAAGTLAKPNKHLPTDPILPTLLPHPYPAPGWNGVPLGVLPTVTYQQTENLAVEKFTDAGTVVQNGDQVNYVIILENLGPDDIEIWTVKDESIFMDVGNWAMSISDFDHTGTLLDEYLYSNSLCSYDMVTGRLFNFFKWTLVPPLQPAPPLTTQLLRLALKPTEKFIIRYSRKITSPAYQFNTVDVTALNLTTNTDIKILDSTYFEVDTQPMPNDVELLVYQSYAPNNYGKPAKFFDTATKVEMQLSKGGFPVARNNYRFEFYEAKLSSGGYSDYGIWNYAVHNVEMLPAPSANYLFTVNGTQITSHAVFIWVIWDDPLTATTYAGAFVAVDGDIDLNVLKNPAPVVKIGW
jgi:hypothetical protein